MASPEGEAFYCFINMSNTSYTSTQKIEIYAYISTFTAPLGFSGSFLQMTQTARRNDPARTNLQQSSLIVFCLALSDALACTIIIVKSIVLLAEVYDSGGIQPSNELRFLFQYVERYFYICTCLWTFAYAIDIMLKVKGTKPAKKYYHLIWFVSAVLIAIGLFAVLYEKPRVCSTCIQIQSSYITSYWLPLLSVMVGNPVILRISVRRVNNMLRSRGIYTDDQRQLLHALEVKFAAMTVVFYLCWLTSPLIIIISAVNRCHFNEAYGVTLLLSAFFNPLQGFLNWFVYGRTDCFMRLTRQTTYFRFEANVNEQAGKTNASTLDLDESTEVTLERSPLLAQT
eukprot:m.311999 g.311999  ORF g.311999 m.311999 type:complete len:341 (+) comp194880_c0_seq1:30-1052(+)